MLANATGHDIGGITQFAIVVKWVILRTLATSQTSAYLDTSMPVGPGQIAFARLRLQNAQKQSHRMNLADLAVSCRASEGRPSDPINRVDRHRRVLLLQFETEFAQHREDRREIVEVRRLWEVWRTRRESFRDTTI
jgi:hypothetical protein